MPPILSPVSTTAIHDLVANAAEGLVFSIFSLPTLPSLGSFVESSAFFRGSRCAVRRAASNFSRWAGSFCPGSSGFFGLFLFIQVVEVAEPLVEALRGGKKLIAVSEVILPQN
jgi:hypothetical protein